VLQAANTGMTSLQKLVDTAQSLANQALQTSVGYSTKSNVSATIPGATSADLHGTTSYASAPARSENIHLLRICTDNEINVVVKAERLCLIGDRCIDF
jgi:flagellin